MKKGSFFLIFLLIALLGYGYYRYNLLSEDFATTKASLDKQLADMRDENGYVLQKLNEAQLLNDGFQAQVTSLVGTVGTLDKLNRTDRELLQKYSKVYFLNENYVPESLSNIPPDDIYEKGKIIRIHTKVEPFLQKMVEAAKTAGVPLEIISGYRSFEEQNALKQNYKMTYGSGANAFSADQGYSEHQLGTALDFTTPDLGSGFDKFKSTEQYKWLEEHAHEYGFILSYPAGNAYYQFEPWHWRFVGVKLATYMHNGHQNFYDLGQRDIDNYLVNIFDDK